MPARGGAVTLAPVRRKRSSNEVTRSCRRPPAAKGHEDSFEAGGGPTGSFWFESDGWTHLPLEIRDTVSRQTVVSKIHARVQI
jgi:hypothetical protein